MTADGLRFVGDETAKTASVSASSTDIQVADIPSNVKIDGADYAVTSIADRGFYLCRNLAKISVPATVTAFGSNAFLGCSSLHEVAISDLAAWCAADFDGGFANPLVNGADLFIDGEKADKIVLPDGLTAINDNAFCGCNATEFVLPAGVSSIGDRAFYGCANLNAIDIPGSVKSLGISAFDGCSALTAAVMHAGIESIGAYAFSDCSKLETVTLPSSLNSIGNDAFAGCAGLKAVNIDNVAAFCCVDFGNAASNPLAKAHHLYVGNDEVTSIDTGNDCTKIIDNMFSGCTAIENVRIGNAVKNLGESAFEGCSRLATVVIDGPVAKLATGVFGDCPMLKTIELPATVTEIAFGAFYGCTSLEAITLPASVTTIGKSAFYGCSALTNVTVEALTPPAAKSNSFSRYDATLNVPAEALDAYKQHDVWSLFETISPTNSLTDLEIEEAETPAVYYNLRGQRIVSPFRGQLLITRSGKLIK